MSLLSTRKHETLDDTSKKILDDYKSRTGMDHNLFKVLAHKPELLHAFSDFTTSIYKNTTISKSLSELIMIYVSKRNKTPYWGAAHSVSAKRLGVSNQKIDFITNFEDNKDLYEEDELAVLEFTMAALKPSSNSSDRTVKNVRKFFSESQVLEILFYINLIQCTNTINNSLNIQMPDELLINM